MKRVIEWVKVIVLVVVLAFIGAGLLCLIEMMPVHGIEKNLKASADVLVAEGQYPVASSRYGGSLDNWTDAVMISECIYNGKDNSAWNRAMLSLMPETSCVDPIGGLDAIASSISSTGKTDVNYVSYGRYWHGYKVILKPLLSIKPYMSIRKANLIAMILSVLLVCILMAYRKCAGIIIPYLLTFMLLMPEAIYKSMQYSTCFYSMQIGLILLLILYNRVANEKYIFLFSLIGVITNYVDLLTYPLVPFAITLIAFLFIRRGAIIDNVICIIKAGVAWSLGYGGMWIMKWVLATVTTGFNVLQDAATNAAVRADGGAASLSEVFWTNYNACFGNELRIYILIYIIIALGTKIYHSQVNFRDYVIYLLVMIMPVVWYFVFRQHSIIHTFFTNKEMVVIAMSAMVMCTPRMKKERF